MARPAHGQPAQRWDADQPPPAIPPEEPVYLELGFLSPSDTDDPTGMALRIYEPDKCHVIAELRFSRAHFADMLSSRGRTGTMIAYRTRRLEP